MLTSRNYDAEVGCFNGQEVEEESTTYRFGISNVDEKDPEKGIFIEAVFADDRDEFLGERYLSSMYGNVKALISLEDIPHMRDYAEKNGDLSYVWELQCVPSPKKLIDLLM